MSILRPNSNKRQNPNLSRVVKIDDISDLSDSENEPTKKKPRKKEPREKDLNKIIDKLRQIQIKSEFVLQVETSQEKHNFELNYKTSVYS
jgi:hypothetical protein